MLAGLSPGRCRTNLDAQVPHADLPLRSEDLGGTAFGPLLETVALMIKEDGSAAFEAAVRSIVLAGQGQKAARLLVERLSPELRSFIDRLLGNAPLADEAHAATCERLWHGLATFRWEYSLRAWSYIVARRETSRCRARHDCEQRTTILKDEAVPHHVDSTIHTASTAERDQLANMRASLSDEERDLIVLRVEHGLGWEEIALAFLEEDEANPETISREAARLRQRFRVIRARVAAAITDRSDKVSEKP